LGFDSVLGFSGDLTYEVIILRFFGDLPPSKPLCIQPASQMQQAGGRCVVVFSLCALSSQFTTSFGI
jgi:hypothetical protein